MIVKSIVVQQDHGQLPAPFLKSGVEYNAMKTHCNARRRKIA
jgi:hypothetical protein